MSNSVRPLAIACSGSLVLLSLLGQSARCDEPSIRVAGIDFVFASPEQGRALLTVRDAYVQRLSPFDRQARLQRRTPVDKAAYLEFVSGEVRAWDSPAQERVSAALRSLSRSLSMVSLPMLSEIQLVSTTGREESGAAYTRGTAIVLPNSRINVSNEELKTLVAHELFHVISRNDTELRDQLYEVIGFEPSNEIHLPPALARRRITNPDAPVIEHVLKLKLADASTVTVAPVLFAKSAYNPNIHASMFDYLEFQLMEVEPDEQGEFAAVTRADLPVFHSPSEPDFIRQIGRNTAYIIHPEEILADNFAMLMTDKTDVPDPWVIEAIRAPLVANP